MKGKELNASRGALAASFLVAAAGMLPVLLLGAHAPSLAAEFSFGEQAIGVQVGAFFGLAGILAVPAGNWAERVGWRRGITLASVLATSALLVATASRDPRTFVLGSILLGSAAFTLSVPASSLALAAEIPHRLRGTMFGLRQAAVPLAALGAGLSVTYVSMWGWRAAFALAAIVPVASAIVVPRRAASEGGEAQVSTHPVEPVPHRVALGLLAIGGGLATVAGPSLTAFLVLDLVDRGFEVSHAGLVLVAASASGLMVRIGAGWIIDRIGSAGLVPLLVLVAVGALGFAGLAWAPRSVTVVSAIVAYAAGWGWSGVYYYVLAVHFPASTGRATGVAQVGVTAGAALGPFGVGAFAATAGYRAGWGVLALVVLVGLGLLVLASRDLASSVNPGPAP